uniref:2-C-methyl-D-erythritol 2,4-cyclodiphosphate synthase n=1 Tax=Alexandrium monilatum TaxID=311494 RepID=A0A7S4PX52_9DINO
MEGSRGGRAGRRPPSRGGPCSGRRAVTVAALLLGGAAAVAAAPGGPAWVAPLLGRRAGRAAEAAVAAASAAAGAADAAAEGQRGPPPVRIGHGWDIHRLSTRAEAGQGCVIGGVEVDCDLGVVAHSDGDVLYHSATDAVLGALSLPDIGQLFPDTDPEWRGAASEKFLEEAWRLMDERGYRIANLDATLVLQKPRVAPIKDAMKENLSRVLRVPLPYVNVKARTHEKVDSIGEGRALSCHVVVLLERK